MSISAASTIVSRLVRIVDAVAVLRPVDDAHVVVSHSTRVLAVFIITGAAAVLHRCLHPAPAWCWETRCGWRYFLAQFCDLAAKREQLREIAADCAVVDHKGYLRRFAERFHWW